MPWVVGVTFKPVTKIYYFDPAELRDLQVGEHVIVETSRGRTLGVVRFGAREVADAEISGMLKPIVRRATAWDVVQQDQAEHRAAESLAVCQQRAASLGLEMKVVRVEYNFDCSSLLVYFTAEQRVDFRNLVHDLAQLLRTRVEMRQIGVRDEAKALGGIGRCGLSLCCATWLREFTPVSIKMAKQQDLPLNPAEISGVCGRLLCCLSYEDDYYGEARRQMPRINSTLMTPEGPGKVRQVHVLRNTVTVLVQGPNEDKMFIEVPVPEPEGAASGCPGCPARLAAFEDDEEADEDQEGELADSDADVRPVARPPQRTQPEGKPGGQGEPAGQRRRAHGRKHGK